MVKHGKDKTTGSEQITKAPQCAAVAEKGIRTSIDFAHFMGFMMGDLVTGRLQPNVANATCNAAGKLLRVVEMTHRHGKKQLLFG